MTPKGIYDRTQSKRPNLPIQHNKPYGTAHYKWKGDSVGYSGLHLWVTKALGKPKKGVYPF